MSYDSVGNVDASKNLAFGLDFSYKYDPKHQLIDAIESQQSAYSGQFSYTPGGKLKLVDVASPLESVSLETHSTSIKALPIPLRSVPSSHSWMARPY